MTNATSGCSPNARPNVAIFSIESSSSNYKNRRRTDDG
jgi:hypothetical protein